MNDSPPHLNVDQRKSLHGAEYVAIFVKKSHSRLQRLLNRMEISAESDLVDFGCGDAAIINHLRDNIRSYVGVDFSKEFIEVANHRKKMLGASNVNFECDSIINFSKRHHSSFDIGFCLDISEHVYDDEWQDIIIAMFRCLRPGGIFYQHTPNGDFILEILKKNGILLKQSPEHIAVRNGQSNRSFLSKAGFEDITVSFIPHYNILRFLHPLSSLPIVGKYFQARLFITAQKPNK